MQFTIAKEGDLEEIVALCNEVFEEQTTIDYARRVFLATEQDPNQIYVVGRLNGELIAHAKVTIIPTMFNKMNTYALLNHVCVSEKHRRHNIATRMLDAITQLCSAKGCKKIVLWSANFRQPAHACYQKNGFEIADAKFFEKML